MPIVEGLADILTWTMYDHLIIPKGIDKLKMDELYLFQQPRNSDKTWIDTNMYMANVLPLPEHFNIQSMRPGFGEFNSEYDNKQFTESIGFELYIGNKVYSQGPMALFHDWKTCDDLEKLLANVIKAKELGVKVNNNLNFLISDSPIGHHVLQGQYFQLNLTFNKIVTFKEEFRLYWFLDGVISRGVQ